VRRENVARDLGAKLTSSHMASYSLNKTQNVAGCYYSRQDVANDSEVEVSIQISLSRYYCCHQYDEGWPCLPNPMSALTSTRSQP
jgi:hypothetical protein